MDGEDLAENMHIQDAAYQFDNYHTQPPNKTRMDIFNQIIQFLKSNNKYDDKPSKHLNVEITEGEEGILNPSANNMVICRLFEG